MAYLLKMLSDMLQSPQPLSHIQICPKPKVKLSPTDLIHPAPSSSLSLPLPETPIILVSPRCLIGHTEFAFGLGHMWI